MCVDLASVVSADICPHGTPLTRVRRSKRVAPDPTALPARALVFFALCAHTPGDRTSPLPSKRRRPRNAYKIAGESEKLRPTSDYRCATDTFSYIPDDATAAGRYFRYGFRARRFAVACTRLSDLTRCTWRKTKRNTRRGTNATGFARNGKRVLSLDE